MQLEEFELLSDEPIYVEGVGNIKIPKLKDIRKIGYKTYELMCGYTAVSLQKYLEIQELTEQYSNLSDEGKQVNTLYNLLIRNPEFREMYKIIFSFFISENIEFNSEMGTYDFYKNETSEKKVKENLEVNESKAKRFIKSVFKKLDFLKLFNHQHNIVEKIVKKEKKILIGSINNENFNTVREVLLQINRLKEPVVDTKPTVYKNEFARKLAERMEKSAKKKQEENKDDVNFGKIISKYCADNKNGINILNVWDMTIYQFHDQFAQHNHIRQSDIQDMVYANTVSFSDLKAYDSQLWLK